MADQWYTPGGQTGVPSNDGASQGEESRDALCVSLDDIPSEERYVFSALLGCEDQAEKAAVMTTKKEVSFGVV